MPSPSAFSMATATPSPPNGWRSRTVAATWCRIHPRSP
ncbi:hypothetical protein EVA_17079 [gut metagenome]|uniref:Uncharacterized protein n=1 Tax=gut metagenome TaxID=749906 RepID=J9FIS4_9ZZZZ